MISPNAAGRSIEVHRDVHVSVVNGLVQSVWPSKEHVDLARLYPDANVYDAQGMIATPGSLLGWTFTSCNYFNLCF